MRLLQIAALSTALAACAHTRAPRETTVKMEPIVF